MTSPTELTRLKGLVLSWKSHSEGLQKIIDMVTEERDALKAEVEGLKKLAPSDLKELEKYKEFRKVRYERDVWKAKAEALSEAKRGMGEK